MKKIIIILMLSLCFSGCSLINPLKLNNKTNPKKQTAISKSSEVINYRDKEAGIDYQVKRTNYNKDISKYKIQEKIGSYIAKRGLFFLIIILIINWFVPGFIGWFIGFFLNASRNALKETVKAVQKYKDENKIESEIPAVTKPQKTSVYTAEDEDIPEAPDELDTPTFLRKQMD